MKLTNFLCSFRIHKGPTSDTGTLTLFALFYCSYSQQFCIEQPSVRTTCNICQKNFQWHRTRLAYSHRKMTIWPLQGTWYITACNSCMHYYILMLLYLLNSFDFQLPSLSVNDLIPATPFSFSSLVQLTHWRACLNSS